MSKSTLPRVIASLVTTMIGVTANAENFADTIGLSGMFESELAVSTEGDVQKAEFVLTPEVGVDLTQSTRLTVIGRLRGDLVDKLEPGQPAQLNRSSWSKRQFVNDLVELELREAYLDTELGSTFLRLGKQQVVWGQADGLKVLDIINPQSFREFILDDFEDSRIPLWMVNAEIPVGETMLQLLWIPDTTYDDIPEPGATYAFTSLLIVPDVPPGIPVNIESLERPDDPFADSDLAAKLSIFAGGWDLSINYAYHYFDRPVIRRTVSPSGVRIQQTYERTHLLGGTLSNVFGDFTLRGEVGFSSDRYFLTDDPADADGVTRSAEFSYVFGVDYQGWRDWFVSAQIFQSIVTDPVPGLVRDDVDTNITFLLRRDFLNEALQAEALVIQSVNQNDGVLQAALTYEIGTNTRLNAGLDIFYGNTEGLFGQFDKNDRISIGIEIGF